MKSYSIITILSLLLATSFTCLAQNKYLPEDVKLFNFANGKDDNVFEGVKAFKNKDKWGLADKNGEVIIPAVYDSFSYQTGNLITACKGGKWGVIKANGKEKVPFVYDAMSWFAYSSKGDKVSKAKNKDGKWGYINTDGKIVIPFAFDDAAQFSYGIALVKKKDSLMYISQENILAECDINNTFNKNFINAKFFGNQDTSFYQGVNAFKNKDGKWGLINGDKEVIIQAIYDSFYCQKSSFISAMKGGKWGFIDIRGKIIVPFEYEQTTWFTSFPELAKVRKNGKYGYVDTKGEIKIQCVFEDAAQFTHNMAVVKLKGKYYYIDQSGGNSGICDIESTSTANPITKLNN